MIWYAILIPLLVSVVGYVLYKKHITWWELFVQPIVAFIIIVISFYTMKTTSLQDVEYNGYIITEARYYEPYETWVKKTCSYQYACGTYTTGSGSSRTTHTRYCTRYYDCSYCDYTGPKWTMVDSNGNEITITQKEYNNLIKLWSAKPIFVDMNRSINYHGSCGKDGDMYKIKWDGRDLTSITTTYSTSFENILKCNHSAFNYPVIQPEEAKKQGLFEYPAIGKYNHQTSVLGLDSINYKYSKYLERKLDYLNGMYGAKHKVRVYTLFFKNKDINIAFLQEAYWDGGNQNEIVVCIGVDNNNNLEWVKPFSWCDNKRVLVDIREDIMESKTIKPDVIYNAYVNTISTNWKYKSFEDFNYLSFQPTSGQLIFVYVLVTIISILSLIWCIKNEIDNE